MDVNSVELGDGAKATCRRLGIAEGDVRAARAGSIDTHPGREFLVIVGALPDGRPVRMLCRHDRPQYVATFRPL